MIMTYKLILLIVGWLCLVCDSIADPMLGRPRPATNRGFEDWPIVELDLSEKPLLKEIFDSGLRPYRFPAMETGLLEAKHFRVRLKIEGQQRLPVFPAEYVSIGVAESGQIMSLHLTTPQLSFSGSRNEMKKWLGWSSYGESRLDDFLSVVKQNPSFWKSQAKDEFISRGFPIVWNASEGSREGTKIPSSVSFKPTFGSDKPLRIRLGLSWSLNFPLSKVKNYRIPIPPPAGYEHIDMAAPKNFGPDKPSQESIDAKMAPLVRERGLDKGDVDNTQDMSRIPRRNDDDFVETNTITDDAKAWNKWPIVLAIVLVLGGVFIWLKAKSRE